MPKAKKVKEKDLREITLDHIQWLKQNPRGRVKYRIETKTEMFEAIDLIEELVEDELKPRFEVMR